MIRTKHKKWADFVFYRYINHLFRKHFRSVHLLGSIPRIHWKGPLVLIPNHSTWWDGFFIYVLNKKIFHRRLYLMMLENQLRKFPFFAKVGAYSIQPETIRGIKESVQYTVQIMRQSGQYDVLVCIFPQGILTSWYQRPLGFKRGIETVLKAFGEEVMLLPLGIKALFLDSQYPQVFMKCGQAEVVSVSNFKGIQNYEKESERLLNEIIDHINSGDSGLTLFSGSRSISDRINDIRTRWNR